MQIGNGVSSLFREDYLYASKSIEESSGIDSKRKPFFAEEIQEANLKKESIEDVNSIESKDPNETKDAQSFTNKKTPSGENLDPEEVQYIRELESIDRNVRSHEAAHVAAGAGVVTGGASFTYTRGPDGKMYATAGEVPIAMKEGRTPEETIQNARQIVAAAMAPSDPSPQDYKVAASAAQMESRARVEQAQEKSKEAEETLKKQEESKDGNSVEQEKSDSKDMQSPKKDLSDSSTENQDSSLRNYVIQSYKVNFKNYSPMLEIAG